MNPTTQAGERFASEVTLSHEQVSAFAHVAGDTNPLHHDQSYAAESSYGGIIASGPQTSALLMGVVASHFSERSSMVGLEFWFRFRRPVLAGQKVCLEWLVISARHSDKLHGEVVDLRGRLKTADGATAVGAKGKILVSEAL